MKKLITFVLLMFVGIGLVGCQNDSKKSEGNPKVKQSKVHTAKSEPFQELIDSSKSTDEIYVTDDITVGEKGDVKPAYMILKLRVVQEIFLVQENLRMDHI